MSLTATTDDNQGKRPTQTVPLTPPPLSPSLTNPSDPSDVESATLQHRRPADVADSEFGLEAERPTYNVDTQEELGGDYDYDKEANLNEDDEGDDGEIDVDEEGKGDPELDSYDEALSDKRVDLEEQAFEQEETFGAMEPGEEDGAYPSV